jgi:hypothetical protein
MAYSIRPYKIVVGGVGPKIYAVGQRPCYPYEMLRECVTGINQCNWGSVSVGLTDGVRR